MPPLPKPPPRPPKPRSRLRKKNPLNKIGKGGRRHQIKDRADSQRIHELPCISGCQRPSTPAHIVGRANKPHRHNPANILPLCQYCHDWYDHTAEGAKVKREHRRIIEAGGIVSPEQWLTDAEAAGLRRYLNLRNEITQYFETVSDEDFLRAVQRAGFTMVPNQPSSKDKDSVKS